jgi:2-desacetyl-2-hydroxyethyl bacteriochlorophyllide A dehydrogenase
MRRRVLEFEAPRRVRVLSEPCAGPEAGEVAVATHLSAISAGSELLAWRGELPDDLPLDDTLPALARQVRYPLRYGYAAVGHVCAAGEGVDARWIGRRVFGFQPHASRFVSRPEELVPLPADLDDDAAALLPGMETAVTLVLDGRPRIGERVVVLGQGVVGLLLTALLARFPLARCVAVDGLPRRRTAALELGAHEALAPASPEWRREMERLAAGSPAGADLVFELSGQPEALNTAIAAAGFGARVVLGSWYGTKRACLDLGAAFHRRRITLLSSQVSTLAPELGGRWHRQRRFETVFAMLRQVRPERLITHRFDIEAAAAAYDLLENDPGQALQVVLTYPGGAAPPGRREE